jgi:hypothetical protein
MLIAEAGGCCALCGYERCVINLHFHHVDPTEKSFQMTTASGKSLEQYRREMKKCVLLCANCHGEIEAGIIESPPAGSRFLMPGWLRLPNAGSAGASEDHRRRSDSPQLSKARAELGTHTAGDDVTIAIADGDQYLRTYGGFADPTATDGLDPQLTFSAEPGWVERTAEVSTTLRRQTVAELQREGSATDRSSDAPRRLPQRDR